MSGDSFPTSCLESSEYLPGWLLMSARDRKSSSSARGGKKEDDAFDIWLKRGLHQLFDDVANEPIPEELLRLLEEDEDDQ